jgi:multiple sugar transport system ATP-binding protein
MKNSKCSMLNAQCLKQSSSEAPLVSFCKLGMADLRCLFARRTIPTTTMRKRSRLDFTGRAPETPFVARVVLEHLTKDFPGPDGESVRAISDLGLTVEDRELVVLVGPSGCGKTTTLRLVAGLEEPTAGTISIDGRVVNGTAPKDRNLAMVFQSPALYPHLSVYDNLAFGLKVRNCGKPEIARRVKEAAEMLGLGDCLARLPMALSGGQRQRVAIGRALVRRPGLFLFDEPLSNLDPQMRCQLRSEIAGLHRRLASTMLYVTHDQTEALLLGDRVGVMRAGALQQLDKPLKVYREPASVFVAGFIGSPSMNFFTGRILAEAGALYFEPNADGGNPPHHRPRLRLADSAAGNLPAYAGKAVVLGIRPEHVISGASPSVTQAEQTVTAMVGSIETTGPDSFLHATWDGKPLVARVRDEDRLSPGDPVVLGFDMRHARFFDPSTEQAIKLH